MADGQRDEVCRLCFFFLTDLFFVYHFAEELWILVCHFRECHELSHSLRGAALTLKHFPFDVEKAFGSKASKEASKP